MDMGFGGSSSMLIGPFLIERKKQHLPFYLFRIDYPVLTVLFLLSAISDLCYSSKYDFPVSV